MNTKLPLLWLLPFMTCIYAAIASEYPYYAMWDSSQVYTLDALIAGSGQLPDHFFHPNLVPLVLYRYVLLPLGKLCGFISVSSISELQRLPNPYLSFAETAIFLIRSGYFFALVFLSFMYLTIFRLLSPFLHRLPGLAAGFASLTLAALALVWQYMPCMLIWIRNETIGLALWSIALYATVAAAEAPQKWRSLLVAGLCSGAAVLCKVQLAGGVMMLPFVYAFVQREPLPSPGTGLRRFSVALAIAVALLLALLHGTAYYSFTHHDLQPVAFHTFIGPERFVPVAPAFAVLFCIFVIYIMVRAQRYPALAGGIARLTVFAAAFCSVLLLALLIGTSWNERLSAACWTYVYSFMFGQLSIQQDTKYFQPIDWGAHLTLSFLFATALIAIIFGYLRRRNSIPLRQLTAGICAVLVAGLGITVLLRPEMRKDGMLCSAWTLLAFLIIWRLLMKVYPLRKMLLLCSISAWLIIGLQAAGLANFHSSCRPGGNEDYSLEHWKNFSYGFRGRHYEMLMQKAYPDESSWLAAFRWSTEIPELKLLLRQVFGESRPALSITSLALPDMALGGGAEERLSSIAPEIAGALLVPLPSARVDLDLRADFTYYLITRDLLKKPLGRWSSVTDLLFATSAPGRRESRYSVQALSPGPITIDAGQTRAFLALKRFDNRTPAKIQN